MASGSGKEQPSSSRRRPWQDVMLDPIAQKPEDVQTAADDQHTPVQNTREVQPPANDQNKASRGPSLIPIQSVAIAYRGQYGSTSENEMITETANADDRAKPARRPRPAGSLPSEAPSKPSEEDRNICKNAKPKFLTMHNGGKTWADMGREFKVRPRAMKSMLIEMGMDTEENRTARKRAKDVISQRNHRAKEKERRPGNPPRGVEKKLESAAKKPL